MIVHIWLIIINLFWLCTTRLPPYSLPPWLPCVEDCNCQRGISCPEPHRGPLPPALVSVTCCHQYEVNNCTFFLYQIIYCNIIYIYIICYIYMLYIYIWYIIFVPESQLCCFQCCQTLLQMLQCLRNPCALLFMIRCCSDSLDPGRLWTWAWRWPPMRANTYLLPRPGPALGRHGAYSHGVNIEHPRKDRSFTVWSASWSTSPVSSCVGSIKLVNQVTTHRYLMIFS